MRDAAQFESSMLGICILITLISVAALVIIPFILLIMHFYYKHKAELQKAVNFKTGFCYFISTILFCINYCATLLNNCFGCMKYDYIFTSTTAIFYGLHFILLIYLLVCRIYFIFRDTAYRLSNVTLLIFISLSIFAILDMISFVFIVLLSNNQNHLSIFITYTIGIGIIILLSLCITLLYIYKLFQIIRRTTSTNIALKNDILLKNLVKYTNLAIVWITTSIILWCIPYTAKQLNSIAYLILYYLFILIDVTSNTIAFALGYSFADPLYGKVCNCCHHFLAKLFIFLVHYTRHKFPENEVSLETIIAQTNIEPISIKTPKKTPTDTNITQTAMHQPLPSKTPMKTPTDTQIEYNNAYKHVRAKMELKNVVINPKHNNTKIPKLQAISLSVPYHKKNKYKPNKLSMLSLSAQNDDFSDTLLENNTIPPFNNQLISVEQQSLPMPNNKNDIISQEILSSSAK